MHEYLMVVTVDVAQGSEDVYREWHHRHIGELVEHVDGVVSGRRYELHEPIPSDSPFAVARFLAIYGLSEDTEVVRERLKAAQEKGLVSGPPPGVIVGHARFVLDAADETVGAG